MYVPKIDRTKNLNFRMSLSQRQTFESILWSFMIKCKRDKYIYVKYALSQSSMYRPSTRGRGRRFSFPFTLTSRQWTRKRDKVGLLFALKLNFDRCTTRVTFWYLLEFSFFFVFSSVK